MSAVDRVFEELRRTGQKALMPFLTAGDPDVEFTVQVIKELARRGSSLCEVGIPYSDPIADGPVIQASYTRALEKRIKLAQIFDALSSVSRTVSSPIVTMVSYAIVYRHGAQQYIDDARQAGVTGLIVPDLPVEEAAELSRLCTAADMSLIQLITPTTSRDRALRIAASSTGFIYYVSVAGITGERTQLPPELIDNVAWLREQTPLPICIGFGISQPEHVRMLKPVADGLIVGSAIVRRMADVETLGREKAIASIGDYVRSLLDALKS